MEFMSRDRRAAEVLKDVAHSATRVLGKDHPEFGLALQIARMADDLADRMAPMSEVNRKSNRHLAQYAVGLGFQDLSTGWIGYDMAIVVASSEAEAIGLHMRRKEEGHPECMYNAPDVIAIPPFPGEARR